MKNRMKKTPKPVTTLAQLIEQVSILMQVVNMQNERINNLEISLVRMIEALQKAIGEQKP